MSVPAIHRTRNSILFRRESKQPARVPDTRLDSVGSPASSSSLVPGSCSSGSGDAAEFDKRIAHDMPEVCDCRNHRTSASSVLDVVQQVVGNPLQYIGLSHWEIQSIVHWSRCNLMPTFGEPSGFQAIREDGKYSTDVCTVPHKQYVFTS